MALHKVHTPKRHAALRIIVAFGLPALGLLWFSGHAAMQQWRIRRSMITLHDMTHLGSSLGDTVHELQKERGATVGVLISHEAEFADRLHDQRNRSDEALEILKAKLNAFGFSQEFDFSRHSKEFTVMAQGALKQLEDLTDVRKAVDELSLSNEQMIGYYRDINASLLDIVAEMELISSDRDVSNAAMAYSNLLKLKEHAGLERAMGAAGFTAGRFSPQIYKQFLVVIAAQDMFAHQFRAGSTEAHSVLFDQTMRGPVIDEVDRLRAIVTNSYGMMAC